MNLDIVPYVGIGPILFGMTCDEIQKVMGVRPEKFKKSKNDDYYTDQYETFFVYYKKPGICNAVEFYGKGDVKFFGEKLLGRQYIEVLSFLRSLDDSIEEEEDGATSYRYGIGIYAPFAQESPFEEVESVIVFEKGYFD